jgi:hypothetical protein
MNRSMKGFDMGDKGKKDKDKREGQKEDKLQPVLPS